jgi:hypothetical protein
MSLDATACSGESAPSSSALTFGCIFLMKASRFSGRLLMMYARFSSRTESIASSWLCACQPAPKNVAWRESGFASRRVARPLAAPVLFCPSASASIIARRSVVCAE